MRQFLCVPATYVTEIKETYFEMPSKVHIGVASMRQCRCVPATYVTEFKETYFEIHSTSIVSFKHLKLPNSIKIPVTIWQIDYNAMTAISPNLIS